MTAKYIILTLRGETFPVLWPVFCAQHIEIASRLRGLGAECLAAGFVIPAANWHCHGESLTLALASRGEIDAAILRQHFGAVQGGQPAPSSGPAELAREQAAPPEALCFESVLGTVIPLHA